jgi:hypothetical protein
MTVAVYNPFPEVEGTTPIWHHSGICYSRVLYATREEAEKVAEYVRSTGAEANGGFYHGMQLGNVTEVPQGWEVDY